MRLGLEALVVYAIAFGIFYWRQFLTQHMPGTDGYYHIKVAWIYLEEGLLRDGFPWAQYSLWRDSYFDKEFGFHVLLMPFAAGDGSAQSLMHAAKLSTVVYGALVYPSFYAVLRLSGVKHTWFWTLVFFGSGAYFGWRINVPRPQIISMSIALWAAYFVLQRSWKGTFAIAAVYALCYTAPLVTVVYAGVALVLWGVVEDDWDWRVLAASVVGVFAGWLLHPHFPNNFRLVWIQLVDVLGNAWGVAGPNLSLGGEFRPADTRSFLREHVPVYFVFVMAMLAMTRVKNILTPRFLTLFGLANAWFIMTCMTKRFVEYWVPLTVFLAATIFTAFLDEARKDPPRIWQKKWLRVATYSFIVLFMVGIQTYSQVSIAKEFRGPGPGSLSQAAVALQQNTPAGAQVYTCDWDDAPELFFHNHHNRYMVFLDPNFMYKWDPSVWHKWNAVANGKTKQPADEIVTDFKAYFGVCTNNFSGLRRQLQRDPRAKVTTHGGGYVFALDPAARYDPAVPPPRKTAQPSRMMREKTKLGSTP